ncbi:MAG: hypothetical protein ACE5HX_04420 [bacterium]
MAGAQINPSNFKASYNSTTKKQQAIFVDCDKCDANGIIPTAIDVTVSGIGWCSPPYSCCEESDQYDVLTDYGNGWDLTMRLQQGRVLFEISPFPWDCTYEWPPVTCQWSACVIGDFGGFDTYNLGGCSGGIAGHSNFGIMSIRVQILYQGGEYLPVVWVILGFEGYKNGRLTIFNGYGAGSANPRLNCFNYDETIYNDIQCGGEHPWECYGGGTAIITEI